MHSPGPWTAEAENDRRPAGVSASHNQPLADVFGSSRDEREANARLIAAAPEMLEALRRWQEWADSIGSRLGAFLTEEGKSNLRALCEAGGDAIAKAGAEQPRRETEPAQADVT